MSSDSNSDSSSSSNPRLAGLNEAAASASTSKYSPPAGYQAVGSAEGSIFDAAAVGAQGAELWAVRLPQGVKPKHLTMLELDLSHVSASSGTVKVGEIKVHKVTYGAYVEVTAAGGRKKGKESAAETREAESLTPIVPCHEKGKQRLVICPALILKTLFLRREVEAIIPAPSVTPAPSAPAQVTKIPPKPIRVQPPGLQARNVVAGATTQGFQHPVVIPGALAKGSWREREENLGKRGTAEGSSESPKKKKKKVKAE